MDRKRWTTVLIVVVVLLILGTVAALSFFLLRTRTSPVENGEVSSAEQELERTLPSVVIQQDEEAAEVRAFYLDCKQASFNKDNFMSQLQSRAADFSRLRVSLGTQPIFTGERAGQTEEVFTTAPDALFTIGNQFSLDPRVLAVLIELESSGLTKPAYHPRFPLLYPEVIVTPEGTSVKRDEFQIQVGIAADTIKRNMDELRGDAQLVEEQSVTAQSVLKYLVGKGYAVSRVEDFIRPGSGQNFIDIFRSFFGTDPRVCQN